MLGGETMQSFEILQKIYDQLNDGDGIINITFNNFELKILTTDEEEFIISAEKVEKEER